MKVYLCGPINKCTDNECKSWRQQVKEYLPSVEYLDPMRRDFRGMESKYVKEIIRYDEIDIISCDIILANVYKPSWGTAMEIFYAYSLGRIIYGFGISENPSPWLIYHTTELFLTLEDAVDKIRNKIDSENKKVIKNINNGNIIYG